MKRFLIFCFLLATILEAQAIKGWENGDFIIPATNKLYPDGKGDTYWTETSADVVDYYVGGVLFMKMSEAAADSLHGYVSMDWHSSITISQPAPVLQFKDDNAAVFDVNADISVNLTNTGDGTENADVTMSAQVAGVLTPYLTFDADANLELASVLDIVLDPVGNNVLPGSDNADALGVTGTGWSDLFLGSGAVIDYNSGDVTLTHSANLLTITGGYTRVDRLEVDGATDWIDIATDLIVTAAADIQFDPGGGDVFIGATNKFYFDGRGDTYVHEPSADVFDVVVGGNTKALSLIETAAAVVMRTQEQVSGFAIVNATVLGELQFYGDDDTAAADEIAGKISVISTGVWTDGAEDSKMLLQAANNGTLNADQLVLNTDGTISMGGALGISGGLTITMDDPFIYYDPSTAAESEWWTGVNHDAVGDDNDNFEIRQSATPGTNVEFYIQPDGDVFVTGDFTITGDDLFMTTNTTGFILRADGTNYNPVSFVNSADLAGMMSDETGTVYIVYSDSPTFTTQVTMDGNLIFPDPGTSANSDILYMRADNTGTVDEAQLQVMYGADPYLRISAPADAGTATPVLDIHDTNISYGNGAVGVDYVWTVNGETNDGTITYMEDEDRFDFDNDVNIGGDLVVTGSISSPWTQVASTGDNTESVTHNLGYRPFVWVYDTTTGVQMGAQVSHTDVNTFVVTTATILNFTVNYR